MSNLLTTLGLGIIAAVLVITGLGGEALGLSAMVLFSLGLLLLLIASIDHFASNNRWRGAVVLVATLALFGCSWLPWYGRHVGEPGTPGGGYHRHPIWHLGHVH